MKNTILLLLLTLLMIGCSTKEKIQKLSDFSSEIEAIENGLKHGTILERMEAWDPILG